MRTTAAVTALALGLAFSQPSLARDKNALSNYTLKDALTDVLADNAYAPPTFVKREGVFYLKQKGAEPRIFIFQSQLESITKVPYQGAEFAYYDGSVFVLPNGGREIIESHLKSNTLYVYSLHAQLERNGLHRVAAPIMAATSKGVYFMYAGASSLYYIQREGNGDLVFNELPLDEFYLPQYKSLLAASILVKSHTRSIVLLNSPQLKCSVAIVDGITLCYDTPKNGGQK
ncbi:MAG: hypothetical protein QXU54_03145 [Candidatus Micrarchaeia archaeon]